MSGFGMVQIRNLREEENSIVYSIEALRMHDKKKVTLTVYIAKEIESLSREKMISVIKTDLNTALLTLLTFANCSHTEFTDEHSECTLTLNRECFE